MGDVFCNQLNRRAFKVKGVLISRRGFSLLECIPRGRKIKELSSVKANTLNKRDSMKVKRTEKSLSSEN